MSLQELYEIQKFIVLGYKLHWEMEIDRKLGVVVGASVDGSMPDDAVLRVTGEATREEWAAQCLRCDEPPLYPGEAPHIGFLKVVAE